MPGTPSVQRTGRSQEQSHRHVSRRLPHRNLTLFQCDTLRPANTQPWLSLVSLLQSDPHMSSANNGGNTCLHYFAVHGKADYCALALARGADPNARNIAGDTSLHMAVRRGGAPCAKAAAVLIRWGVDIEAQGFAGERPLASATRCGNMALVDILLAKGADVSALSHGSDGHAASALLYAIARRDAALARKLIAAGACPETDRSRKPTLLEFVRVNIGAFQCLREIGVELEAPRNIVPRPVIL